MFNFFYRYFKLKFGLNMNNNIEFFVLVEKHYLWDYKTFTYITIFYTHNDIFKYVQCFRQKLHPTTRI